MQKQIDYRAKNAFETGKSSSSAVFKWRKFILNELVNSPAASLLRVLRSIFPEYIQSQVRR